jgi:hypothetical protein
VISSEQDRQTAQKKKTLAGCARDKLCLKKVTDFFLQNLGSHLLSSFVSLELHVSHAKTNVRNLGEFFSFSLT